MNPPTALFLQQTPCFEFFLKVSKNEKELSLDEIPGSLHVKLVTQAYLFSFNLYFSLSPIKTPIKPFQYFTSNHAFLSQAAQQKLFPVLHEMAGTVHSP